MIEKLFILGLLTGAAFWNAHAQISVRDELSKEDSVCNEKYVDSSILKAPLVIHSNAYSLGRDIKVEISKVKNMISFTSTPRKITLDLSKNTLSTSYYEIVDNTIT